MSDWFDAHHPRLSAAIEATLSRSYHSPFQESPSRKHHPPGAPAAGKEAFEAQLGRSFELELPGEVARTGHEVSPYTREPLGIDYPQVRLDALLNAMHQAWPAWRDTSPRSRVGVCLEILDRLARQTFENAHATMHTAGQGFLMAFAGSGANSLDRGLEALAYAHRAMSDVPLRTVFSRRFGPGEPVVLHKRYRLVARGIACVVTCGSYPAWNAYPALFANLATGNPVVVKPHPGAILPMALAVRTARSVLAESGFDPNLVTLLVDTARAPVAEQLLLHPRVAIVDFTGSQRFGRWIEKHCRQALVFTETAGCNAVVLESTHDLHATARAIAHSVCIFSSQMCTAAQNVWVPASGVRVGSEIASPEAVAEALVAATDALVADPAQAAGLCGALFSDRTLQDIVALQSSGAPVLRPSTPYAHPDHAAARTATPLWLQPEVAAGLHEREHFGPMAFVLQAVDRDEALMRAASDAQQHGAIASYAYTTDETYADQVEDAFAAAGASVGLNLHRQLPINYAAAFSDFHVTGLNPAGTACLTDLAFVTQRFGVVQSKREQPPTEPR
ncbi:MAG: phenylacetic acid degradation protein PaaN [Myxococcales bacterium]|nr:phenylacetic acid degradation protein PaaN [Myxococcales bacterium]